MILNLFKYRNITHSAEQSTAALQIVASILERKIMYGLQIVRIFVNAPTTQSLNQLWGNDLKIKFILINSNYLQCIYSVMVIH